MIDNDFYNIGIVVFFGVANESGSGGHFVQLQRAGHSVYDGGVDQGFVTLNIDDGIALATSGNFRNAVRAAGMTGRGHFGAAEILCDLPNSSVVSSDDYFRKGAGLLTPFDDVLDERFAGNESEWFAGKTCGSIAGGNDADDFHRLLLAAHRAECTEENGEQVEG